MQNFDYTKVVLLLHGTRVCLFVGIQFTIATKDRISQKQKYTRLDAIEYGVLSIFNVCIIIPVATQVLCIIYNGLKPF